MSWKLIKRYRELLDKERGTVHKDPGGRLNVALAYPNLYHLGMSNLGFQVVYRLANDLDGVVCERSFLPGNGEAEEYASARSPLLTLESQRPVRDFDVLAFSLCFENDYSGVLRLLELAGISLLAAERPEEAPLVLGGGVAAMLNPEPLAAFFDLFFVGEAEAGLGALLKRLAEARLGPLQKKGRSELLATLAREVPGVYVPSLYRPEYHADGRLAAFHPSAGVPARVKSPKAARLDRPPAVSAITTPEAELGDMYLVEVARGCGRSCRFCAAGYVYRPPRNLAAGAALGAISALEPGRRCGLVGAAISDYPHAAEVGRAVVERGGRLSVSSLRADSLEAGLLAALQRSGYKSAAIAPEAGSERLRRLINKGLTEDDVKRAAESLARAGAERLKLYFMIGLPTEEAEDIGEIVALAKRVRHHLLKSVAPSGSMPRLALTVASFVPKPHTPFQWAPMTDEKTLKERLRVLERSLRKEAVEVTADVPKYAYVQAVLARGDRRVQEFLLACHATRNWRKVFRQVNLNADFYAARSRERDELFPWDFIDHGVRKDYLWQEWQRALAGEETPRCRPDVCHRCGVCPRRQGRQPNKLRRP
ncbi:MAG: radical SAM protein [Pseudomonadota bacterium]